MHHYYTQDNADHHHWDDHLWIHANYDSTLIPSHIDLLQRLRVELFQRIAQTHGLALPSCFHCVSNIRRCQPAITASISMSRDRHRRKSPVSERWITPVPRSSGRPDCDASLDCAGWDRGQGGPFLLQTMKEELLMIHICYNISVILIHELALALAW